jgi:UDP-3-O-[3-hydroxymyristoyl] glucosamine N-acyltransferase
VIVRDIAELIQGEVVGDANLAIQSLRTLDEAQAGDLTFVDDEKYTENWLKSPASVAIVPLSMKLNGDLEKKAMIRVAQPMIAFAEVFRKLNSRKRSEVKHKIHPSAVIHETAKIGTDTVIGPHAVVGEGAVLGSRCLIEAGVSIGAFCIVDDDTTLHPNVVIYDECKVGKRVTIHANSVIGADGFGYRTYQGKHVKVPQLGNTIIEDDVEIGSCTTIDRATFGSTVIGQGSKIDNQVQIAHNCKIGKHNILVSQVGIAGSCSTGDYVVMAGQVGCADHIHIGEKSVIGAKAGLTKDVPAGSKMLGAPATPDREQMRILMSLQKLPDMRKDLKKVLDKLGIKDE